jgi:hypothetical protein
MRRTFLLLLTIKAILLLPSAFSFETKPLAPATLVSESTDVLPLASLQSSSSTQAVIPETRSMAAAVFKLTNVSIRESATIPVEMLSAMPTQTTWTTTVTWATWTATMARVATGVATRTARVGLEPSSSLLERLVRNKPSIWGNKSFYIVLSVLYLMLLGLFLKQILSSPKCRP